MYHFIGNSLNPKSSSSLGAWFGCDKDEDEIRATYRIPIYPGKWNIWIVARDPAATENVDDVVEDWIEKVDTSWFSDPAKTITQLANVQDAFATIAKYGNAISGPSGVFTGPGKSLETARWYFVSFLAPDDAPTELPWPFMGCPEKVKWLVTNVLSPLTNDQTTQMSMQEKAESAASTSTLEKQRQESLDALLASRQMESEMSTTGTNWLTWLLIAGGVGAAAYWYVKGR